MKHEEISEEYEKWIIEFISDNHSKPIFFIWLTDISDSSDKDLILVNQFNKIISANSKRQLIESISKSKLELPDNERTIKWLSKSIESDELFSNKYNLKGLETTILSNNLNEQNIETIVNFINLYEDYKLQLGTDKSNLKSRTSELSEIWEYYHEQIFFPNFNRTSQERYQSVEIGVNNEELLKEFQEMLKDFENSFQIVA